MKIFFERFHLKTFARFVNKWIKGNKNNDDDWFDHPFAIF